MKRIASIQDISCLGRCSLTVALPVISALGVECAIVPTAVLSAHTAFPGFVSRDLTDQLDAIAAHWQAQHVHFDALYTGYIASVPQVQQVLDFFDAVKSPDTMIFVDPAMADHGKLYSGLWPRLPRRHGAGGGPGRRGHAQPDGGMSPHRYALPRGHGRAHGP